MFEFVEKVIYINLDYRTDRRAQIEKELLSVFPPEKIIRQPGFKESNGHIGASRSHVAALEMAVKNNWSNVLIVEDDAKWLNLEKGHELMVKLMTNPYDVILLGSLGYYDAITYRVEMAQAATAYFLPNHYFKTFLNNFKEGLINLVINPQETDKYCLDQYWKLLQKKDRWYRIMPHLMYQEKGYSDILNMDTDFTCEKHFNIEAYKQ